VTHRTAFLSLNETQKTIRAFYASGSHRVQRGELIHVNVKRISNGYFVGKLSSMLLLNKPRQRDSSYGLSITVRDFNNATLVSSLSNNQLYVIHGVQHIPMLPEIDREMAESLEKHREFHWGVGGNKFLVAKVQEIPKFGKFIGYLGAIIYTTRKSDDSGQTKYVHAFQLPLAKVVTNCRQYYLVGGNYRIESRGIVK
jgi:hypothetical protein